MTNLQRTCLAAACAVVLASSAAAGELKVTMQDGRVTVVADNVPVRQILAEWAKVGQTKIVGGDKMPGGPVTLRLENVPERQALDVLLRAASGFMVVERAVPEATLARFDRILILPTSTAPAGGGAGPAPASAGRGGMNQPSPSMAPQAPQPAPAAAEATEPEANNDEPAPNDDARPPETNFDYANPQQFLQKRLEQLQQQQSQGQGGQAPTTFPGTVSPYGMGGTPTQASPTSVPGSTTGSARPGEMTKAPVQQPTMVNPYGIPVTQPGGPGAMSPMQPDRAKYANPYQPTPPPPIQ